MKKSIFLTAIVLFTFFKGYSQDISLPPTVLPSAGSSGNAGEINIAKWRLGEVHLVTFSYAEEVREFSNLQITAYPNPVRKNLHISFQIENTSKFSFEITNLEGKRMLIKEATTVLPGAEVTIDVTTLASGLYLLSIIPPEGEYIHIAKFQKQ